MFFGVQMLNLSGVGSVGLAPDDFDHISKSPLKFHEAFSL